MRTPSGLSTKELEAAVAAYSSGVPSSQLAATYGWANMEAL